MIQVYFILSSKIILLRSHLFIPLGDSYLRVWKIFLLGQESSYMNNTPDCLDFLKYCILQSSMLA